MACSLETLFSPVCFFFSQRVFDSYYAFWQTQFSSYLSYFSRGFAQYKKSKNNFDLALLFIVPLNLVRAYCLVFRIKAENTNLRGSITVQLTSCFFLFGFSCLLNNSFTCFVKSKPVKQEVIYRYGDISPMASVLWMKVTPHPPFCVDWKKLVQSSSNERL